MRVNNQKPQILSPVYKSQITGDFEPDKYLNETMVEPLFEPLVAGQPVEMKHNGNDLTSDDIKQIILNCLGDTIDATAEAATKEIFSKTLVYFDKKTDLTIQETFAIQAGVSEKMPFPSPSVMYTPSTDVIPTSKEFLAGQCTYEKYFTRLAYYARTKTLGFYFANDKAFDAFKTWLDTQVSAINAVLPAQTNTLFTDFQANINLTGLTESLIIRNNDSDNNEEYSFARTIVAYLMRYASQVSNAEFGVLPFDVGELYCPKTLVFVNVEKHAHATAKEVADEWKLINQSLTMKIRMIANNKISKLTSAARNLKKIQSQAANAASNARAQATRASKAKFRKTPPTPTQVLKLVTRVIGKMSQVSKSENTYKSMKMTFAKPNRRDPDDFNKKGKIVSTKYKPDLHIYLDTSGSISESNYQASVKMCIALARKLNVNLYFNSFSHVLSQCSKINVKDKSAKQAYMSFRKIDKVSGGTDYEQIWHYINKSKKRKRELSLIITDFEWSAPNRFVKHPKNLYYIACADMDWDYMKRCATNFCDSMKHIDPKCRSRLLL